VSGRKKLFVTGAGTKLVPGGLRNVAGGAFVGVVPFRACKTRKARCKSSRNCTSACSVGGSMTNVFVPNVTEKEVCSGALAGTATATLGAGTRLGGFDVIGAITP